MKAIIVEDELLSIDLLRSILLNYCPEVEVVGEASNYEDAVVLLQNTCCDIVFMDIQLHDQTSFEVISQLDYRNFSIIFTTAFHHYAIEAFKVEAIDYLLKPYTPKQVIVAVDKAKKKLESIPNSTLNALLNKMSRKDTNRIGLTTQDGILFVDKNEIIHCIADGSYCKVFLTCKEQILLSKSLGEIEQLLTSENFIRVHTSHLVNVEHIRQFLKEDGGELILTNGNHIPVSRRKKMDLLNLINI